MIVPDAKAFARFAENATIVPVIREVLADLETPLSVLARFAAEDQVFLFESIEGGERFGRYSFIGVNPRGVFTVEAGRAYLTRPNGRNELHVPAGSPPLFALRELLGKPVIAEVPGLPPFIGGAVGYIGYETVNEFETLPPPKTPLTAPTAALLLAEELIVFDNIRHTVKIIVCARPGEFASPAAAYQDALARIEAICFRLRQPVELPQEPEPAAHARRLRSNLTRDEFCEMVEKARAAIHAGEAIQIVLSQKFTAPQSASALSLYRALRLVNPSPYTFFLKIGERTLVGSSPETMVKLENGHSSLRPIAGTRKRGATPAADRALADELLLDEKERAEHLMLVDLGRNDLGRTARPGSVQVRDFMHVERYSHVMHLVSDVDAELDRNCDAFDLLRGTFPAGTLSGAPKIRAMELINELECAPRGVYGGAVGYFSSNGNLDLAITIRTMEICRGEIAIQSGAGIVYDSDPEKEYEETLNKAAALFKTVELAATGLNI